MLHIDCYFRDINRIKLLSADEERDLSSKIQEGCPIARNKLIESNLRLVISIAKSYKHSGVALEDIIEEGNIGLIRASESYDGKYKVRFSTYASYWIHQSIKRAINRSGQIRIPDYVYTLIRRYREFKKSIDAVDPTFEDVIKISDFDENEIETVRLGLILIFSRDAQADTIDSNNKQYFEAEDKTANNQDLEYNHSDIKQKLTKAIENLLRLQKMDRRMYDIIEHRFELNNKEKLTLIQLSRIYKLSRERIRQIESDGMKLIRTELVSLGLEF